MLKPKFFIFIAAVIFSFSANLAEAQPNENPWHIYTNKDHQFSFRYPANLYSHHQFSAAYFLNKNWSVTDRKEKNNPQQHSLVEVILKDIHGVDQGKEAYYFKSFLRIGTSVLPEDVKNCQKAGDNFQLVGSSVIDNKKFSTFEYTDAGMSQYLNATVYRYTERGMCYSIEYVQTGSNNINMPRGVKSKELAKEIIKSFEFMS
jgi:hypothetical protein